MMIPSGLRYLYSSRYIFLDLVQAGSYLYLWYFKYLWIACLDLLVFLHGSLSDDFRNLFVGCSGIGFRLGSLLWVFSRWGIRLCLLLSVRCLCSRRWRGLLSYLFVKGVGVSLVLFFWLWLVMGMAVRGGSE